MSKTIPPEMRKLLAVHANRKVFFFFFLTPTQSIEIQDHFHQIQCIWSKNMCQVNNIDSACESVVVQLFVWFLAC